MKALFVSSLIVLSFGMANAEIVLDNSSVEQMKESTPVDLADGEKGTGTVCTARQIEENVQLLFSNEAEGVSAHVYKVSDISLFGPETALNILSAWDKEGLCDVTAAVTTIEVMLNTEQVQVSK